MNEQTIEMQPEAYVAGQGGAVNSVNGQTGDVVLTTSDLENTSDYQTGSEVEATVAEAVAGKQDTLTAGNNIQINGDTISATDTTYTAGSGLDLTGTAFSVDTSTIATKQSVDDEITARQNADNSLQGQIDAISASSDVTDIVGTYADLQAYDTTHLKDNDIIKVLQDESQNDETTYYRWSTSTQTFTLIGEEGPYYTKSAVDTLLNAKQNTLTAGTNITIASDNTISATDTTYSNFTGTDGTSAGAAGLVPAPATTDAGKFLKADGTWDEVEGGITELTTSDLNYPVDNPLGVALWLLPPGIYHFPNTIRTYPNASYYRAVDGIAIVGGKSSYLQVEYKPILYRYGTEGFTIGRTATSTGAGEYSSAVVKSDIIDNLTSTATTNPLSANQGKVLKDFIGDLTNLTTTDKTSLVAAINEAAAGGGGGPTVVQTTGTSTTDVMSQNATTSMVFADSGTNSKVRIGNTNQCPANGVSIGLNANTNIGTGREAGVALGMAARAAGTGAIALGARSNAPSRGQFDVSTDITTYGYNNSNYRLLTGLYDGQSAHDAANVGQLNSRVIGSLTAAPTTSTAGAVGALVATVESGTGHLYICTDDTGGTYTWQQLV